MSFHADETISDMRMRVREEVSRRIDTFIGRTENTHHGELVLSDPPRGNAEKMASRIARFRRKLPGYLSESENSIRNFDTAHKSGNSSDHPHPYVISEITYLKGLIQAESRRLELLETQIAKQKGTLSVGVPFLKPNGPDTLVELHTLENCESEASRNCEFADVRVAEKIGTPSSGTAYPVNSIDRQPLTSCHLNREIVRKRFIPRRTIQLKNQADYLRLVSRNISPKSL